MTKHPIVDGGIMRVFVFVVILALMSLGYLPLLTSHFLFHDDYVAVLWNYGTDPNRTILSHHYLHGNLQQGRFFGHVLNAIADYYLTIQTSPVIRFSSVVLVSVTAYTTYWWLRALRYPDLSSFVLAVTLATLPPFQSSVFGITSGQYILFGILCAQLSFILLHQVFVCGGNRYVLGGLGAMLLLVAQFTYTTSATFFMLFLVMYAAAPGVAPNRQTIRRIGLLSAVMLASMLFYVLGTVAFVKLWNIGFNPVPGRDFRLNTDVLGRFIFYLTYVVPKTAHFWYVQSVNHRSSPWSIAITGLTTAGIIAGIYALAGQKATESSKACRLGLISITAAGSLMLSVLPMLAPVPGDWVPFRTLHTHMAIVYFLAFSGLAGLAARASVALRQRGNGPIVATAATVLPIAFALVVCGWTVERYVVRPMTFEQEFVRHRLQALNRLQRYADIALIPTHDERQNFLAVNRVDDTYAIGITPYNAWRIPLIVALLREQGFQIDRHQIAPDEHSMTWPGGRITIVPSADLAPKGALLIDMNQLYPLSD